MTDEVQLEATESSGITQFSYSIAEFNILLEPTAKTEIVEQREIFPIPHAPEWCRGMISLRGKLLPVIDLHLLLGRKAQGQSHWLLIIESSPLPPVAIRIDHLPTQYLVDPEQLQKITDQTLPFWLESSMDIVDTTVYRANHQQLFELLALQNQQAITTQ